MRTYIKISKFLLSDFFYNPLFSQSSPHILFVRDLYWHQYYNSHFLRWIKKNYPEALRHIRIARVSKIPLNLKTTRLLVPWLRDPLKELHPDIYTHAAALQKRAINQHIPVINRVENLSNGIKSRALELIGNVGIRTARTVRIHNPQEFNPAQENLSYPFFIREDIYHRGPIVMINNDDELKAIDWKQYESPLAVEYINAQDKDGYFRKYRYILMGDEGFKRHLIVSKAWCIHAANRICSREFLEEEKEFIQLEQDPNHDLLNQARKNLGLDFVAFDYSYDQNDQLVVWEPNVLPGYWTEYKEKIVREYQTPAVNQIYVMLLNYYFKMAGMEDIIKDILKLREPVIDGRL